ncbi:MAG: Flp pilus assembly protein CpaB [Bacteriovoracaceae bacterium]
MNSRAFTMSILIAGIAMLMVYSYIADVESGFKQQYGSEVPVLVAKTDIKELELIDDRKVTLINVPQKFKMPGAFKSPEEVYNTIAAVPIKEGEQITKPRVTWPGDRTGLSRQISVGKRGFSIQVSEEQAVSRLIKPGDRVDVLTLVDYAGGRKEMLKVKTVLQDVYVLATGKYVTKEIPMVGYKVDKEIKTMNLNTYTNFNTVTLELSPYEVQKLIFLVSGGGNGVYLSLRNNDDKTIERISGTRLFDVLGEDAAEAKAYFAEQAAQGK